MKPTLLFMTFLIAGALAYGPAAMAKTNETHPSVIAALSCIDQMAPFIKNRRSTGPDVACDIPVSLSETDLDELFQAALRSSTHERQSAPALRKNIPPELPKPLQISGLLIA